MNHFWLDFDRRKGIKVDVKPTFKPRPNTNAPKYNPSKEYDDESAMKKIQATVEKQQQ